MSPLVMMWTFTISACYLLKCHIKCIRGHSSVTQCNGGGGVRFPGKGVTNSGGWFNVISVTRGWVGVKFAGKMRYVTLQWPLTVT